MATQHLLADYRVYVAALRINPDAKRLRRRAAERLTEVHPDLWTWLSRPTAARLADLSRSKAWPMFASVPDPRDPRGVRHPLSSVLVIAQAAVAAGARTLLGISARGSSGRPRPTRLCSPRVEPATGDASPTGTAVSRLPEGPGDRCLVAPREPEMPDVVCRRRSIQRPEGRGAARGSRRSVVPLSGGRERMTRGGKRRPHAG